MYQQSRKFRSFRKPTGGSYFGGRSSARLTASRFGNRPNFNRPQSKLVGRDINMFIKKAAEIAPEMDFVPHHNFNDFDIVPTLKQNIADKGYTQPTPIQDQAIGPILEGRDLIGLANTGTGKTAAFLIPLINKIYKDRTQGALIIVPTRELAGQILDELRAFTKDMKLSSALIIGGANINRQINDVRRNPHFIIGTPGRLRDLIERGVLYLDNFSNIVLDEVDLMVDIGFINDVKYFISMLPSVRQSLFFSATLSPKIREVLNNFVTDPVTVSVKQQDTAENINQDVVKVQNPGGKVDQLHDLLIKDGFDKVLIFGRTKHGVEKLHRELDRRGFKVGAIHGNKTQGHRQRILQSFKSNEIQILLATDVASRGLDIPNVSHVINFDLPETYDDYIHRIGRTGRAGKSGTALTFVD